jgi:hypothetical protein
MTYLETIAAGIFGGFFGGLGFVTAEWVAKKCKRAILRHILKTKK